MLPYVHLTVHMSCKPMRHTTFPIPILNAGISSFTITYVSTLGLYSTDQIYKRSIIYDMPHIHVERKSALQFCHTPVIELY